MKFFTRQHEKLQPRRLKSAAEMEEAWQRILERRRLAEPDDSCGIDDRDMLSNMWIAWQIDWLARELTQEQRRLRWASKTKMFSTWCESHIGCKNFIMAVWQIGLTWAPSPDLFNTNFISAMEHIAKNSVLGPVVSLEQSLFISQRTSPTSAVRVESGLSTGAA